MLTLSAPHRQVVWGMLVHLKRPTALFHAGPASGASPYRPPPAHPTTRKPAMATPPTAARSTSASAPHYADRVVGCLLGGMCGDVLGAAVEGWDAEVVAGSCPGGCTDFLDTPRGRGCYTDDTEMTLALALALVKQDATHRQQVHHQPPPAQEHDQQQQLAAASAAQSSSCGASASLPPPGSAQAGTGAGRPLDVRLVSGLYAAAFDPARGYGGGAVKSLRLLQEGMDPALTGTAIIREGSFANGGAMRIAPVGLAYRRADIQTLATAVRAALLPTHVHAVGVAGALLQAMAVAWLCKQQHPPQQQLGQPEAGNASSTDGSSIPPGANTSSSSDGRGLCRPEQLLQHLQEAWGSAEVRSLVGQAAAQEAYSKLEVLASMTGQLQQHSKVTWTTFLRSPAWQQQLATSCQVAPGFQIRATDAVAAALLALTCHWEHPEDALTAAVHYGGDTDTIAAMVGAAAGALHGTAWLPQRWLQQLENQGPQQGQLEQPLTWSSTADIGRDAGRHLALALAQVDAAEW